MTDELALTLTSPAPNDSLLLAKPASLNKTSEFKKNFYMRLAYACNKPSLQLRTSMPIKKKNCLQCTENHKHYSRQLQTAHGTDSHSLCYTHKRKNENIKQGIFFPRPSSSPLSPLFLFPLPWSPCQLKHVVSCCASMWSDDQRKSGVVIVSR